MPQDNKLPEPGEFTRMFKRQHLNAQGGGSEAEKGAADISGVFPAAELPSAEPAAQPEMPPLPPPPRTPAPRIAGGSELPEPGEFTQYFTGGLPSKSAQSGNSGIQRGPVGVQRPNTPVPPRNLTSDSSTGSFTERFAPRSDIPVQKTDEFGVHNPRMGPAPDLSRRSPSEEGGHFDFKPMAPPLKQDAPGEYTALFGAGSVPPPPRQSVVAQPPAGPMMNDSPNSSSAGGGVPERTLRDVPVAAATPRPSEYTMAAGGRPGAPPAASAPPEAAGNNSTTGTKKMPINVNLPPVNPMAAIQGASGGLHGPAASAGASMTGAHATTPIGSASVHAPTMPPLKVPSGAVAVPRLSDQTKLILFFGVLAILAVVLIVVLVATQKS
jgi:hypothetical protein